MKDLAVSIEQKLVILKLEGDLEQHGFQVTLEIRSADNSLSSSEHTALLPPSPELAACLARWQHIYSQIEGKNRIIKLDNITINPFIDSWDLHIRQTSHELVRSLRKWLSCEEFQPINWALREALSQREQIRLLIRTKDNRLHHLPWHCWDFCDRYPVEVAFSTPQFERVVSRQKTSTGKTRILAILSDSQDIDVHEDRQVLESLLNTDVMFLVEPSRQQITEQLWEQQWDILFFAGHSATEGSQGRIYINRNDSLTLSDLKYGLKKSIEQGLQLAIFNSCDGLGLANELAQLNIPQIVVMRQAVPDKVAQDFFKNFLHSFASGETFYISVREARERLQALEDRFPCASWLPAIFQNAGTVPLTWEELRGEPDTKVQAPTLSSLSSNSKIPTHLSLRTTLLATIGAALCAGGYFLGVQQRVYEQGIQIVHLGRDDEKQQPLELVEKNPPVANVKFGSDNELDIPSGTTFKMWQRDGKQITDSQKKDKVTSVNFSPDSQILAVVNDGNNIKLWRRDGTLIKTLQEKGELIVSINFSPDSQTLAVVSGSGTVKLWRRDGTLIKTLQEKGEPSTITFMP